MNLARKVINMSFVEFALILGLWPIAYYVGIVKGYHSIGVMIMILSAFLSLPYLGGY